MKRKALMIAALVTVLLIGLANSADAHRWGCRGRGYGYYRPARVWIAPPPPPPPAYGYYRPRYNRGYVYNHRPRYYGYNRPAYGYRRW